MYEFWCNPIFQEDHWQYFSGQYVPFTKFHTFYYWISNLKPNIFDDSESQMSASLKQTCPTEFEIPVQISLRYNISNGRCVMWEFRFNSLHGISWVFNKTLFTFESNMRVSF